MTLIDKAEALAIAQSCPDSHWGAWIADRLAALPARGVGVKPLVWEHHNGNYPTWIAQSYPFSAVIDRYSGQGEFGLTINGFAKGAHPSLEAAKAAAQADYEARVLAALAPTDAVPADLAEASGGILRALRDDQDLLTSDAADLIATLLARIAAQEAQIKGLRQGAAWYEQLNRNNSRRAEAAETALAAMTKERDELAKTNNRQAACLHYTAAELGPDYVATVDGLPKAARHVAAERDALLGAVKGLVEVLDQHETKGPLPDVALMFCWLAAQNVRAALRGNTLEKPE